MTLDHLVAGGFCMSRVEVSSLATDQWNSRQGKKLKKEFRELCFSQGLPCWLCGQPIDWDAAPQTPNAFEPDHFHPRSTHPELALDPENLRPSHCSCNRSRQDGMPAPELGMTSEAW